MLALATTSQRLMTDQRLDYDASIARLRETGFLDANDKPRMPDRLPQANDDVRLGLSFFRTFLGDGADLSDLTIPRTFFGRSEIGDSSFKNSDLSESNLCWNDFIDVDFSRCNLARSDLRASSFTRVDFSGADLRGSDLRRSDFQDCRFDGAAMDRATLTRRQAAPLALSSAQRAQIAWTDDDGPEPSGG
jgi:BTB/POZ domain-containing protein KCTD9